MLLDVSGQLGRRGLDLFAQPGEQLVALFIGQVGLGTFVSQTKALNALGEKLVFPLADEARGNPQDGLDLLLFETGQGHLDG